MSKKINNSGIKEFAKRIPNEDLQFLVMKLARNWQGDRIEVVEYFFRDRDIERWMQQSSSAMDWYDMSDYIIEHVMKEHNRRSEVEVKSATV